MSTTTAKQISPAIKRPVLANKATELRTISAAARDNTTSVKPQILVRETATQLAAAVPVPETKPPVSVLAFERQLAAESVTRSIAGFYATNLRVDMKNFKRAEHLFKQLRSSITDEESLKLHLNLLAKNLRQLTKSQVALVYKSGRISFMHAAKSFTQSLVFAEQGLEIYTRWEGSKQVELLRATRYAIDHSRDSVIDDLGIWNTYLRDGIKVAELNKALDIAERQRLKLKDFIAKLNHKTIATLLSPSPIIKAKIKTDKKLAAFADLTNAHGQTLSLKVTRLVSSAKL